MPDGTNKPVIFLAFANDRDDTVGYLRNLPDEARRLRDVLEPAEPAGLCEVVVRSNSTAGDIFKVFQDPKYRNRIAIFHYGGHANGYQLLLESPAGKAAVADAGGLAAFFAQQQGLQLVFLNGCSTQQQTQELLDANVSAVISTSRSIDDQVATDFAYQFYQGLAGGATIRTSYNEASAAITTTKGGRHRALYLGDADKPEGHRNVRGFPWNLYVREGYEDADQWNLPEAVNDPLFGLPPLPERDLPERPYKHLNWFTRGDAEVFFGRGRQIREMYDRVTAGTQPIILFYGQSGVGKSSLLDAGLLPRLERDYEVCYSRRGAGGLLATLRSALRSEAADVPIESAWLAKEEQLRKPLIVFLDQLEEFYTRPIVDLPEELDEFLQVVKATFNDPNRRPKGKLVLGFRKEWLAELEARLIDYELPRTKVFLEPLDRSGIIEVVQGPARADRLRERYGLTVEEGLAEIIADDLLEDRGSAIAPTLQILLTKMWAKAMEANYDHPYFSQSLYQQMKRDGILLRDFLNQQIAAVGERYSEAVDSGLLLDILALHTTPLGTADQYSVEELQQQYAHLGAALPDLLQQSQDLYLLTIMASAQNEEKKTTRLAHDTLAPLVREQFDLSDKPGQRARRILDNRAVDFGDGRNGTPLDEADLVIVEVGLSGTRALSFTEQRLVKASRELRTRLQRSRKMRNMVGAMAIAVIAGLGVFGWWNYSQADKARNELEETNTALVKKTKEAEDEKTNAMIARNDAEKRREEAERHAREANRQTAKAFWQVATIARDRNLGIKAAHNFLRAAQACDIAGEQTQRRNIELAAQFATACLVRSFPHDSAVVGVQVSNDESHVLAWSGDGAVKLWDVTKAEPLQAWKHEGHVHGVVFTRDESRVLSWSSDGAVKLWDATQAEPLQVWKHEGEVKGAVFTRDASRVLSWSDDGAVKLWAVTQAEPLQVWKHEGEVNGAVFSRDESRVLAWSGRFNSSGDVKLWDVANAEPLQVWKHEGNVKGAVFTGDESRVLAWSGFGAGEVKLWDVTQAEPLQVWKHEGQMNGAVFTRDDSRVLAWSGAGVGEVKLWDVTQAEPLQVWKHDVGIYDAVFTRDESRVLGWGYGTVTLWDVTQAEPLQVWKHDGPVNGAVFTRDESGVLAWSGRPEAGEVKLWDVKRAEPLQVWKHESTVFGAVFTRDESRVFAWSGRYEAGAVKLWDVTQAEPLQVWKHDGQMNGAVFTRDESRVFAWSGRCEAGAVKLWDVTRADPLQMWKNEEAVEGAVFTRDESRVLAWSWDGKVNLWDVTKATLLQVWKHEDAVLGAVFTRDESRVLAWSLDGEVKLWDVEKAEPLQLWKHEEYVLDAVFTRDASRVLAWSDDGAVKLWDVTKAEPLQVWKHEGRVKGALFTRDESRVLAWSWDGVIKLWNVTNAEPLQVWMLKGPVNGAVFTRDESRVLAWSGSLASDQACEVRLWDVTKAEPLQVWQDDEGVNGAVFTRDESRVLAWSRDGAVKLWDAALKDGDLTPTERIVELEVHSATRLDSAGQLVPLNSDEWTTLVRSPQYAAIQKKKKEKKSADRIDPSRRSGVQ